MPYYRCPSCGLTSYSAASSAILCATCSAALPPESKLPAAPGAETDAAEQPLMLSGQVAR